MYAKRMAREREKFLAGSGDQEKFDRMIEIGRKAQAVMKEQIEAGTYYGYFGSEFNCVKGRKMGLISPS